jgi:hypothetical protein
MGRLLPSGKFLLESVGGAHSNALLGRFAYLDDQIEELCKQLADTDQQSTEDVIFAEVIFIPGGRLGNIAEGRSLKSMKFLFLHAPELRKKCKYPLMISWYQFMIMKLFLVQRN